MLSNIVEHKLITKYPLNAVTRIQNLKTAVETFNRTYPGEHPLLIQSFTEPDSNECFVGLWKKKSFTGDLSLFWLILDGYRYRYIQSELSFETRMNI